MEYLWLKIVHILGATLLFGTGLGTAFFMWRAHLSGDVRAIAVTGANVVLADFLFTTPAVIAQPVTGVLLALETGVPLLEGWVLAALLLYGLTGACWLPVVWLQMRAHRLAKAAVAEGADLPPLYHRTMRVWFRLGWPAFLSVMAIFYLMVFKPDL